jgi:hypothetical protein
MGIIRSMIHELPDNLRLNTDLLVMKLAWETALILDSRARLGDPNNFTRRIGISMLRNHTGIRKLIWAQN